MVLKGSCLCGDVRYEVTDPAVWSHHCHCSRCRKSSGGAFASNLFVPLEALRFEAGQDQLKSFKPPDAERFTHVFCGTCGSTLPFRNEARGLAGIPMGSLDDDPRFVPKAHIFVDSKPFWSTICDELPQHPEALGSVVEPEGRAQRSNDASLQSSDASGNAEGRVREMKLARTTPILRMLDESKAREFYVEFLGFSVDWEHRFSSEHPLYMQVSRGDCIIHLSEHHGDGSPGSAVLVETEGIDDYCSELEKRNYKYFNPSVVDTDWETRIMTVLDPFGNRITFSEPR